MDGAALLFFCRSNGPSSVIWRFIEKVVLENIQVRDYTAWIAPFLAFLPFAVRGGDGSSCGVGC